MRCRATSFALFHCSTVGGGVVWRSAAAGQQRQLRRRLQAGKHGCKQSKTSTETALWKCYVEGNEHTTFVRLWSVWANTANKLFLSSCCNFCYTIMCFQELWTSPCPYLNDWAFPGCLFHTKSRSYHLLPVNLFTCGMLQTVSTHSTCSGIEVIPNSCRIISHNYIFTAMDQLPLVYF